LSRQIGGEPVSAVAAIGLRMVASSLKVKRTRVLLPKLKRER
jgi:hypothetical protein